MQRHRVGPHHFSGSTGYGHGDLGREAFDLVRELSVSSSNILFLSLPQLSVHNPVPAECLILQILQAVANPVVPWTATISADVHYHQLNKLSDAAELSAIARWFGLLHISCCW